MALASRVVIGLIAASLACVAALRAHADAAYRDGLGYTDRPAEDVPGRLEAYEEAVRRAPDTFTYLLRSGQIHQARAEAGRGLDDAELIVAGERLRAAMAAHPLDARVQVAIAQQHLLERDVDAALDAASRACALGPRHAAVQAAAVRVAAQAWLRFGRVDGLRLALDLEASRVAWQPDAPPLREIRSLLRAREDDALGDLLEACAGKAARLEVAHRWAAAALPDVAPVLDAALQRARSRE